MKRQWLKDWPWQTVVGHYIAGTAGADELARVLEDLE